jgi:hypothetical protein
VRGEQRIRELRIGRDHRLHGHFQRRPVILRFAPIDTRNQSWILTAEPGVGPAVTNAGSVPNWSNVTQSAQSAQTRALVASSVATDPLTALETPAFTLSASAVGLAPGQTTTALGNMLTSGSFLLVGQQHQLRWHLCQLHRFRIARVDAVLRPPRQAPRRAAKAHPGTPKSMCSAPVCRMGFFFDFASTVLGDTSQPNQSFTWTATWGPEMQHSSI